MWHLLLSSLCCRTWRRAVKAAASSSPQSPEQVLRDRSRILSVLRNCCSCLSSTWKSALMHLRRKSLHYSELWPTFKLSLTVWCRYWAWHSYPAADMHFCNLHPREITSQTQQQPGQCSGKFLAIKSRSCIACKQRQRCLLHTEFPLILTPNSLWFF